MEKLLLAAAQATERSMLMFCKGDVMRRAKKTILTAVMFLLAFASTAAAQFVYDTTIECDDYTLKYDSHTGIFELTDTPHGVEVGGVMTIDQDGNAWMRYTLENGERVESMAMDTGSDYIIYTTLTLADGTMLIGSTSLTYQEVAERNCQSDQPELFWVAGARCGGLRGLPICLLQ